MKKENKELARQRRAAEREKAAKRAAIKRSLMIWIPIVLAAAAVVITIVAIATSGNNASTGDAKDANGGDYDTELSSDGAEGSDATLNNTPGTVVSDGDIVNIDYTGYIDGEEFSGGSTSGFGTDLEIGSGSYIEGFEEGIIGHEVGETFDLNLKFPDDYWSEEFAGKNVVVNTTINGIYE